MKKASLKLKTREDLFYLFIALPSLLGLLIFFIIPFVYSIFLVLIDNPVGRNFVGLQNFTITLNNLAFRLAMRNTLIFMAISVPINMIFPLVLAISFRKIPRMEFLGVFFLLPLVIPSGSIVHFWRTIFGINGTINRMLFADNPINWLNSEFTIIVILIIFMWKNAGFNIVLFQAGLNLIPRDYYEVADIEGAGRWRKFRSITFISLIPTFFMVMLMSILATFRSFREIYLLAGAHPHYSIYMLQHYMNNMFAALNYQRLASASYILAVGVIVIVIIMMFLQRKVTNND